MHRVVKDPVDPSPRTGWAPAPLTAQVDLAGHPVVTVTFDPEKPAGKLPNQGSGRSTFRCLTSRSAPEAKLPPLVTFRIPSRVRLPVTLAEVFDLRARITSGGAQPVIQDQAGVKQKAANTKVCAVEPNPRWPPLLDIYVSPNRPLPRQHRAALHRYRRVPQDPVYLQRSGRDCRGT